MRWMEIGGKFVIKSAEAFENKKNMELFYLFELA